MAVLRSANTGTTAADPPIGVVFDLKRFAIHDGPGIRTTVFLKGCPLRCRWCHNPESWREGVEAARLERAVADDGCCRVDRPQIGRVVGADDLLADLERDVLFYDESGGGVTFSGGEPLMQARFLEAMLRRCREHEIHTAIDTTLYADWTMIERIAPWVDLFLADLKHIDPTEHKRYTMVSNDLILRNLERLSQSGSRMFIRMPVVPTVNDSPGHIAAAGRFLSRLEAVERIDLLAYHRMGEEKAGRMAIGKEKFEFHPPSEEDMDRIASQLRDCGLQVKIGG